MNATAAIYVDFIINTQSVRKNVTNWTGLWSPHLWRQRPPFRIQVFPHLVAAVQRLVAAVLDVPEVQSAQVSGANMERGGHANLTNSEPQADSKKTRPARFRVLDLITALPSVGLQLLGAPRTVDRSQPFTFRDGVFVLRAMLCL